MLDLETLGTRPGYVVLSIGIVMFERFSSQLGAEFLVNIERESSALAGLRVDPETEAWWARQSLEAKAALETPEPVSLQVAAIMLHQFWRQNEPERVWAHGAHFDIPILEQALFVANFRAPWHFRSPRDTRTLFDLTGTEIQHGAGVHHSAVDDARAQAQAVQSAYSKLGLTRC